MKVEEISLLADERASKLYDANSQQTSIIMECTKWSDRSHNYAQGIMFGLSYNEKQLLQKQSEIDELVDMLRNASHVVVDKHWRYEFEKLIQKKQRNERNNQTKST